MKKKDLKFFTDENISSKVILALRNKGFDVLDVREEKWHGTDDFTLLRKSLKLKRFFITHDSDFGKLVIENNKPFWGIIYIRLKNLNPINVINVLDTFLSTFKKVSLIFL